MTMQSFAVSLPATSVSPIRLAGIPHILFETWADLYPESTAVKGENGTLTYLEVERRANQIANALRSAGVRKGDLVALFLDRGPDLVCALMGILKSGAAFVALDPKMPKEALARIFDSVDCRFLLSRGTWAAGLPPTSAQVLLLDDAAWLSHHPFSRPTSLAGPHDPACVLFTSGSSGKPKAVLYLHRNLAARFSNTTQISGFDPFSVFAQSSPVTSIDAIDEIVLPLVSGGCTLILPYDTVINPHQLIEALATHRATHILLVPSLLRVILAAAEDLHTKLTSLQTWMIGGEPLSAALTHQFYEKLPRAVLINFYGLTEGDATWHLTSPGLQYDTNVPIGRPVQDTRVYLLDENLKPVPEGQAGEICLAGEGISCKYLNCPELNAERWVSNPFATDGSYARLFRTGDIGRINPDGEIEYLGRRDRLIKVRGFRVELGEVEAVLAQHPAVEQGVAVAKQPSRNGDVSLRHQTYIVAYVVLKRGEAATSSDLRDFLKDHLPDHAMPSMISLLDTFPLSPNGKVDFYALSQLEPVEREVCETYVPPRDGIELRLVRIWEELLNFKPIGVVDTFFEIGGDSLAAIDLMLTIEKEFQCRLPITALIQSPTIASLADLLREEAQATNLDSLVPIRLQGSHPPLFCVHADGSVFIYRRFAEYLDPNIPIYGLQARGLANPDHQPYHQIEEMAAHYIHEIRTVQPHGPYYLCAFSAGGLIIFEMARQLHALGEQVAFVGLLDAYGPDYPEYLPTKNQAAYKASVHLNTLRLHGVKGQVRYLSGRARHRTTLVVSTLVSDLLLKLNLPMPRKIRYEYVARLIDRAAQMYPRGRSYAGDAVLFYASSQPEGIKPDRTLGWAGMITGDLKIVDVDGTHNSIMSHVPHIAELVRKMDDHLRQLQGRLSSEAQ
ncbi:MAG TPA: amino acid adenylation domain-containing protein [Anaerolineales bacterium]|nr:amino acid adenylation domain-containing protein [Anaerolineales bacterium]